MLARLLSVCPTDFVSPWATDGNGWQRVDKPGNFLLEDQVMRVKPSLGINRMPESWWKIVKFLDHAFAGTQTRGRLDRIRAAVKSYFELLIHLSQSLIPHWVLWTAIHDARCDTTPPLVRHQRLQSIECWHHCGVSLVARWPPLATCFPGQLAPCRPEKGRGGNWGGHPHHSVVKLVKHGKKHHVHYKL